MCRNIFYFVVLQSRLFFSACKMLNHHNALSKFFKEKVLAHYIVKLASLRQVTKDRD